MIISLRGTSGAGKSTIVRAIMDLYPSEYRATVAYPEVSKKRPMGYILARGTRRLFVPGHYEIANGGIDTLPSIDCAYDLILKHHELGCDVLYEGKNMSDGWGRVVKMHEAGLDVRVIWLGTTLRDCVASVRKRGHSIAETSIRKTYEKCQRDALTMRSRGVLVLSLSRVAALNKVREWLEA